MSEGECCALIECATTTCFPSHRTCPRNDGTELDVEYRWQDGCVEPSCPWECPLAMVQLVQNCPVSVNTHTSGFLPRQLTQPFLNNGVVTCNWLDCPPYEPCDDSAIAPQQRSCNGNGNCIRGLSTVSCECDPLYEGTYCQDQITVPRPTHPTVERSAEVYVMSCLMVVCSASYGTEGRDSNCMFADLNNAQDERVILQWIPSQNVHLFTFLGYSQNVLYFLDIDGLVASLTTTNVLQALAGLEDLQPSSSEATDTAYLAASGGNDWTAARTSFSYRDADNAPPGLNEYRFVTKDDLNCRNEELWVYFTDLTLSFYFGNRVVLLPWGNNGEILSGDNGEIFLASEEAQDVCENKCLSDANGETVLEVCSENGICDPQTGDCLCNFGWLGIKCNEKAWVGPEQDGDSDADDADE